jgi:hypothetical protein
MNSLDVTYLFQVSCSSYIWPPDLASVFQATGVKIHRSWYSFGEYDLVAILEVPSNVDMATVMIGVRAGWEGKAFDAIKATPLLAQDRAGHRDDSGREVSSEEQGCFEGRAAQGGRMLTLTSTG